MWLNLENYNLLITFNLVKTFITSERKKTNIFQELDYYNHWLLQSSPTIMQWYLHKSPFRVLVSLDPCVKTNICEIHGVVVSQTNGCWTQCTILDPPKSYVISSTRYHPATDIRINNTLSGSLFFQYNFFNSDNFVSFMVLSCICQVTTANCRHYSRISKIWPWLPSSERKIGVHQN